MFTRQYSDHIAILLITILALFLRLHHLDYESLFMDEIRQVTLYGYSLWDLTTVTASQTQPPLDYWVGSLFYKYFSPSDFSVRLPAALFGTASVTLMTWLCSKLYSISVALIIGTFMAISHYLIYFSQDARPYSIATFFFIAVLAVLIRIVNSRKPTRWQYLLLLIAAFLFLLTRTMIPMLCLAILLTLTTSITILKRDSRDTFTKYRAISLILALSLAFYTPFFIYLYQINQRFLATGVDLTSSIHAAATAVNIGNLWQIIVVQAGNIAPLLAVLSVVPLAQLAKDRKIRKNDRIYLLASLFLIAILPLHIFIHHLTVVLPFRPPYAIYLLPMMLLLSGYSLNRLISHTQGNISGKLIILLIAILFLAPQSVSTYAFKNMRIKSDWRSLAGYTASNFDHKYLLIFETLDDEDRWNPFFYGFRRYRPGTAERVNLQKMIEDVIEEEKGIKRSTLMPVLILFNYRNYYLTPAAEYGIFPLGRRDKPLLNLEETARGIQIIPMTGFHVLSLLHYSGNLIQDTCKLISYVLSIAPKNSSTVRMRQLGALLSNATKTGVKINCMK